MEEEHVKPHEFRYYGPLSASVHLSADFLSSPLAMSAAEDGWWRVEVAVPARGCRYFFLVDGVYTAPDYAAGDPEYASDGRLVSVLPGRDSPAGRDRSVRLRGMAKPRFSAAGKSGR